MKRSILQLALLLALSAFAASAQESEYATIECTGEATVAAVPDIITFELARTVRAASIYDAATTLETMDEAIAEALGARTLEPSEAIASGIAVPDANLPEAVRTARIQFRLDPLKPSAERLGVASSLCDAMREIATSLECVLKGPKFSVQNEKEHVQAAILKAAENAYIAGEGAATSLTTQIIGVSKLKVDAILWDFDREWRALPSDVDRVTCKVKVTVQYQHGFTQ